MPDCHAGVWAAFATQAAPQLAAFERSLERPALAQTEAFHAAIANGTNTGFGLAYGFSDIASISDYQAKVPVSRWPEFAPWIERAQREPGPVLTAEVPIHFERTSGSTAQSKDIPYTPRLLAQFQRALTVWLAKLYECCPEVAGPAWWSLSPALATPAHTPNGIPLGSASDAFYLQGSAAETLLASVIDTHASLASKDWKTQMLASVAARTDLTLISVWSPTFLRALLGTVIDDDRRAAGMKRLKRLLTADRYRALIDAVDTQDFSRLWPALKVISAWADGPSEHYAAGISALFPNATIVPKGLFATEGIVSLSWGIDGARPLAIESHFLEFLDSAGDPRLVEELKEGALYEPVLTTTGGLYRYALGDLIEVTGFQGRTPTVRFVGRTDSRSDLVGEKLDEALVRSAFAAVGLQAPAVLLPVGDVLRPHYLLVAEAGCGINIEAVAGDLDKALCDCYHYRVARGIGQLESIAACSVANLSALLHVAWEALGKRSGDTKSSCLVTSNALATAIRLQCPTEKSVS